MILFFGDSLTSAENNQFNGFVEKLKIKKYKNFGVSGTCIGDYSLYPVGDNTLIQLLYKKTKYIKKADKIVLEYGANDITSVLCGYTTLNKVKIDLVKCVDYIRQINPKADIIFLTLGDNKQQMAEGQCRYINYDYLKYCRLYSLCDYLQWITTYDKFELFVKEFIQNSSLYQAHTIPLIKLDSSEISADGIHPNDAGYEKLARYLKGKILC